MLGGQRIAVRAGRAADDVVLLGVGVDGSLIPPAGVGCAPAETGATLRQEMAALAIAATQYTRRRGMSPVCGESYPA